MTETKTDLTVDRVLDLAADKLERDGWCQGRAGEVGGPLCMTGAVGFALTGRPLSAYDNSTTHARMALVHSLSRDGFTNGFSPESVWRLIAINDHDLTSADQAIDALRRAAMRARGETPAPLAS